MLGWFAFILYLMCTALLAVDIAGRTVGLPPAFVDWGGNLGWTIAIHAALSGLAPVYIALLEALQLNITGKPLFQVAALLLLFKAQQPALPVPSRLLIALCYPGLVLAICCLGYSIGRNILGIVGRDFSWLVLASDLGAAYLLGIIWPRLATDGMLYDWARTAGPRTVWGRSRGERW